MPGTTPGKTSVTCAALVASLVAALFGAAATAPAVAVSDPPQPPQHIAGELIRGGADGRPHQVFCPAMQHVYGGGFEITAPRGTRLGPEPTDVLADRPNDNATGWIVAVHKDLARRKGSRDGGPGMHEPGPADLTIHLVCSDDTMSHGA
ncbi:hypothetical protein EDD90_2668 [Streptomyces sp. Ag109_O5-1]|uniref:hypothetical protein n=1 Tax=Streptomyces sp. Ag109_O5-1 TaxID=1938851 RepID=UPI000F50E783|nr:hypothetical protein [Streptomyces sp. Ag109_O5-1]RPE39655.1 hypothetical protein EDD90_2668 [Streptomyces sp. Ag109_O5-1]